MKKTQIPDMEAFHALLRRYDLKATPQRMAVHSAMMELVHASADEVAAQISDRADVKITVASVYNILSTLADCGFYQRRMSADNKMYFDVISSPHVHLYDAVAHEYTDVTDDALTTMVGEYLKRKRFKGYRVERVDIQLVCRPTRTLSKKKSQR